MKTPHSRTIGTLTLIFAILAGLAGVGLSIVIRIALSNPDVAFIRLPELWQDLAGQSPSSQTRPFLGLISSSHALVMICFMMIPALFGGFANWLTPMMIGCADMAFKRLNLVAFLLLPLGFSFLLMAIFLSDNSQIAAILLMMVLYSLTFSCLINAINLITTILTYRAPFIKLRHLPPFLWSLLVASFLIILSLPIMSAALTLKLGDFIWGSVTFSSLNLGSLSIMMWFLTHPELLILILPAFGIISHIIASFAGGRLLMATAVKSAFIMMGFVGFVFWSKTLLSYEQTYDIQNYFPLVLIVFAVPVAVIIVSLIVFAVPVAVIIVSWLLTIGQGKQKWRLPMLWVMGFISILLVAVLSAVSLASVRPLEIEHFVSHFHYILGLSSVFALFAGWYFWFEKISPYALREFSGKLHFWTMFFAVHLTFLPQHFARLGVATNSWNAMIATNIGWQNIATFGVYLSAFSLFLFFFTILEAFIRKHPSLPNPWGKTAIGLEWSLPTSLPDDATVILVSNKREL